MKKQILILAVITAFAVPSAYAFGPAADSNAFKQYQKRPKNDLSKLIYLLDRYNAPGVQIRISGNLYDSAQAFPYSKGYLAKNYKTGENAEAWLRKHCYRSLSTNDIIYMRVDGGDFRPARDVLIDELKSIEKK